MLMRVETCPEFGALLIAAMYVCQHEWSMRNELFQEHGEGAFIERVAKITLEEKIQGRHPDPALPFPLT